MRQNSPESKMKTMTYVEEKNQLDVGQESFVSRMKYVWVQLRKSPLADVYKSLAMPLLSKTASVTTAPSVLIT